MANLLRLLLCSIQILRGSFNATPSTNCTIAQDCKDQEALHISARINTNAKTLTDLGLLPRQGDTAQWFTPSLPADYGDGTCKESNRTNYRDILTKWKSLADTYKIPYFLYAGSLIGASRNADIVPWDGDMDIMVDGRFREVIAAIADERGFDRYDGDLHLVFQTDFRKPVPEEKKAYKGYYSGHRLRFNCWGKQVEKQVDSCSFQQPFARLIKNGRHMDIYDYHYRDDVIYAYATKQWPQAMVFPLKKCMFLELEVTCPQHTEDFLVKLYGDEVYNIRSRCSNAKWISLPKEYRNLADGWKIFNATI